MTETSVSEAIVDALNTIGIRHVFVLPAAFIEPLCRSLSDQSKIEPVVVCHEMAAGYMADGYARVTRIPGVVIVGGGPAAHYLLPALSNARLENVPILALTGGGPSNDQNGPHFQNIGCLGTRDHEVFSASIDHSQKVLNASDLPDAWQASLRTLSDNKPAHLILPIDIQGERMLGSHPTLASISRKPKLSDETQAEIETLILRFLSSNSPLVVLGHRLARSCSDALLKRLSDRIKIPIVTTLEGIGLVASKHPWLIGHLGFGEKPATRALLSKQYDHILMIGAGPGQRDDVDWEALTSEPGIIISRIDDACVRAEGTFRPQPDIRVHDLSQAMKHVLDVLSETNAAPRSRPKQPITANCRLERYLQIIQRYLRENTHLFVDAGLHRISAARVWSSNGNLDVHSSAENAPMGWAICAAIGAKFAKPYSDVVCLTGDGSMRMMGQEIATAAKYDQKILYLVVNNGEYGSVSVRAPNQKHKTTFAKHSEVDWVNFFQSLGGSGARIFKDDDIKPALERMSWTKGPFVLDLRMDRIEDYFLTLSSTNNFIT